MKEFITIQVKGQPFLIQKDGFERLFLREIELSQHGTFTKIKYPEIGVVVINAPVKEIIGLIQDCNPKYLEMLFNNVTDFPIFKFLEILIEKPVPAIVRHWEYVAQQERKRKSFWRWIFPLLFMPK